MRNQKPIKSLAEFYEQKGRLHRQAFDLADRPGLAGNLGKRLYSVGLLCNRYEVWLRQQLAQDGRPLDDNGSRLAADANRAVRERYSITCIRGASLEEVQALGYDTLAEADNHIIQLARLNSA